MKKKYNDGLGPVTKQVLSSFGKRAKSIAKKAAKPLAMAAIFAAAIYAAGRNDYIELIQQRDGSFGLPAIPSKIKMGLKLFVSALSGIITILISKSYTREERTANAINSFFNL